MYMFISHFNNNNDIPEKNIFICKNKVLSGSDNETMVKRKYKKIENGFIMHILSSRCCNNKCKN